ncbi:hypothetical protein ATANTOWER_021300 [Ataeniobius toweri]|uniref:Uncharacterized protein n=1 Tax=Ataeniobius toweri TaxID=208326 RepID=A0ABU7CK04_9TELE|nr:hypothetical protein [Ataeniobius toweri]
MVQVEGLPHINPDPYDHLRTYPCCSKLLVDLWIPISTAGFHLAALPVCPAPLPPGPSGLQLRHRQTDLNSFSGYPPPPSSPRTSHSPLIGGSFSNTQVPGLPVLLFPSGPEFLYTITYCINKPHLSDSFSAESPSACGSEISPI